MRGSKRRVFLSVAAAMVTGVVVAANFAAASANIYIPGNIGGLASGRLGAERGIQVLYRGKIVSYTLLNRTLGATYCDDHLGPGKLTCYSSQRALELATLIEGGYTSREARQVAHLIGVAVPRRPTQPAVADSGTCFPAVVGELFAEPNLKGSEVLLYCDYSNFSTIGWSKKARSGISPNCDILAPLGDQLCLQLWLEINYIELQIELVTHSADMAALSMSGDGS